MAAVGIYSLQNVNSQPVLRWLEQKQYIVRSYMLATSQWQRWNLFSPDPLRRVIVMQVEAQTNEGWHTIRTIDFDHLSYFRRASELKVMRRMEEDNNEDLKDIYLQDICRTDALRVGTPIRMMKQFHVVPKHETPQPVAVWRNWQPEWQLSADKETTCKYMPRQPLPSSDL